MENNEFEKVETKKKKNRGIVKSHKKNKLAKIATVLLIASLISIFAGCTSSCNPDKDDPSIDDPGIITPVPDPDDDKDDEEIENPGDEEENPGDEEENPGEDLPPEDIPPEDIPPDDKPPEENPGNPEIPSDEDIPDSIDKVDEVDEINYFADEFIERVNQNYGDALAKRMIGASATRKNLANADWSISQGSDKGISQIEVKTTYESGLDTIIRVGTITFDQEYSIQDILNGNAGSPIVARAYNASVETTNIDDNTDLGKTVIQTIDADNTLEGDIWCSIGSVFADGGKMYRPITVYQINNNKIEKFTLIAEAEGTSDPAIIKNNIESGLYTTTSQSTEYTFAGEKIEQASASYQNPATYNYYFDDDYNVELY